MRTWATLLIKMVNGFNPASNIKQAGKNYQATYNVLCCYCFYNVIVLSDYNF